MLLNNSFDKKIKTTQNFSTRQDSLSTRFLEMHINFKLFFIITSFLVVLFSSYIFAKSIYAPTVDANLMNSYIAEDESGNNEIKFVVNKFVDNLTPSMTDFEKEIAIIKYLVETVSYDESEIENDDPFITDSYKAYGALVNGKAVCSGYAKAFDLLSKSYGLSSVIVTGTATNSSGITEPHAWNQIYLDGEWYNVDVTWEDPITNVKVGFNNLFNKYINRTDAEFSINHIRDNGYTCTATKYGPNVVAYYLNTGIVDLNGNTDALRKNIINEIKDASLSKDEDKTKELVDRLLMLNAKFDDNSNFLNINDIEVNQYILNNLMAGETVICFVTPPNSKDLLSIDKSNWLENNLQIPGHIEMQKIFLSDGTYDTRILIFNIERQQ